LKEEKQKISIQQQMMMEYLMKVSTQKKVNFPQHQEE
jgi:hypothetical protein